MSLLMASCNDFLLRTPSAAFTSDVVTRLRALRRAYLAKAMTMGGAVNCSFLRAGWGHIEAS